MEHRKDYNEKKHYHLEKNTKRIKDSNTIFLLFLYLKNNKDNINRK